MLAYLVYGNPYSDPLYFPLETNNSNFCDGYFVSSPAIGHAAFCGNTSWQGTEDGHVLLAVQYDSVEPTVGFFKSYGLRPVVCLPPSVQLIYNHDTNMWDINYIK